MSNLPPWMSVGNQRFVQIDPFLRELREHAALNEGSASSRALLEIIEKYDPKDQ
jgi:hypothetical protein